MKNMRFEQKYAAESERLEAINRDKKIIGNDAYAIGLMIQKLIDKIEHIRVSNG